MSYVCPPFANNQERLSKNFFKNQCIYIWRFNYAGFSEGFKQCANYVDRHFDDRNGNHNVFELFPRDCSQ